MKLVIFAAVCLIIYIVATQIKVVHLDTLPKEQQGEIANRSHIRSLLLTNHIKCPANGNANTSNSKKIPMKHQSRKKFSVKTIDSPSFNFNHALNPSLVRDPLEDPRDSDQFLIDKIKTNIYSWNNVTRVNKIILLKIVETDDEFVVQAYVEIDMKHSVYLQVEPKYNSIYVEYYGRVYHQDNFLETQYFDKIAPVKYELELIKVRKTNSIKRPIIQTNPFMTMKEQMSYVDHITKKHQNEIY